MGAVIETIEKGSYAEKAGLTEGDKILSINGEDFHDILEYRFLCSDDKIILNMVGQGEVVIYKSYYEDLGITFSNPLIDQPKRCSNHCIFCFIDQMPKGLRKTLYFKDDDARLSFLHGNYITMTNMTPREIESIAKMRISPVNISVHTTNPDLRARMLNNPSAKSIMEQLRYFAEHSITMNCQIVACPGINDGEEFTNTIQDLMQFYPHITSVSVVPVGLTKYRNTLSPLKAYDEDSAKEMVNRVTSLQKECYKKNRTRFVFAADEFYSKAGIKLPKYKEYEDFYQIENGVGMMTSLIYDVKNNLQSLKANKAKKTVSIATGVLAYPYIKMLIDKICKKAIGLTIHVYEIKNDFFGKNITVSGLLTGSDVVKQLRGHELGNTLYISKNMLKYEEDVFLDDLTIEELSNQLQVKVVALSDDDFLRIIID